MRCGEIAGAGLALVLCLVGCEDKAPEPVSRPVTATGSASAGASAAAVPSAAAVNTATVEALAEVEVVFAGKAMLAAIDEERVYLSRAATSGDAADGPSELVAVPKEGGEPRVIVPRGQFNPTMVAHDGKLFFISKEGIGSVASEGGAVTLLAKDPYGVRMIRDGERLLWTSGNHRQPEGEKGAVRAVPMKGGEVSVVAEWDRPTVVRADEEHVYFLQMPCAYRVPRGGSAVEKLGCDYETLQMAVDDRSLYVVSRARTKEVRSTILRMDKKTRKTTPMHRLDAYVQGMVVEASWLFVTASYEEGGEILALPLGGGPPKVLAKGLEDPFHIHADATHLYVHTGEDVRRVVRVRKPR